VRGYKATLASIAALTISAGVANADNSFMMGSNLNIINQCYYGESQPDPCIHSPFQISALIYGEWKAVRNPLRPDDPVPPWTLDFHPNGLTDLERGTISMSTIGPTKSGQYRIESEGPENTTIFVDMDDGSHYKAGIALYGAGELLLVDENGTTTFHRTLFGSW
jgi:hypothetical protein